ncbi:MAG TPA: CvpA family protein [Gemmataceae bacterium]|jgi:hypothetical protein|nr:CvpA family protein [Gemmataceae bacterium]
MLEGMTILIMLACAYVYLTEGLFTASVMCCNVLAAGLVAFNFFEPISGWIEGQSTGFEYADALCLIVLFWLTLGLLRLATNSLAPLQIEFPPALQSVGGAALGLVLGYLVSGFLVCFFQTLPWNQHFMNFDGTYKPKQGLRDYLPPDRVWLALMHRAGTYAFANYRDPDAPEDAPLVDRYITFDQQGSFEIRYTRYRRYDDKGAKQEYKGEFDKELHREGGSAPKR